MRDSASAEKPKAEVVALLYGGPLFWYDVEMFFGIVLGTSKIYSVTSSWIVYGSIQVITQIGRVTSYHTDLFISLYTSRGMSMFDGPRDKISSLLLLALGLKMRRFLKTRNIYLSCKLAPSGVSE